jgi:hypothetical protein
MKRTTKINKKQKKKNKKNNKKKKKKKKRRSCYNNSTEVRYRCSHGQEYEADGLP